MFKPRDVKTLGDARRIVEERGLSHVKVGLFDNDGVDVYKRQRPCRKVRAWFRGIWRRTKSPFYNGVLASWSVRRRANQRRMPVR